VPAWLDDESLVVSVADIERTLRELRVQAEKVERRKSA
jgi:hypothetical protein